MSEPQAATGRGVELRTVADDEADIRLDRWFKRHLPQVTHGMLEKLLRTGQVRVDGKRAESNTRLSAGQQIRIPPLPQQAAPPPTPKPKATVSAADAKLLQDAILYMDDHVIALNKPAGLATQGGTGMERHLDGMLDALKFDGERPRLVHRLDKDTSGVLLLGRTAGAAAKLAAAFKSRSCRKLYWAVVVGVPKPRQGLIDAPLAKLTGKMGDKVAVDEDEGKRAVTAYRTVEAVKRAAWLEMEPYTGRTHQLRVHCALIETPILGDGKYGGAEAILSGHGISRKLHLHARAIRMPHPVQGTIEVVAPLSEHIANTFAFFGFEEREAGAPFAAMPKE
jgi:23S rRNA pseudouridine955/2504/2580 synthase